MGQLYTSMKLVNLGNCSCAIKMEKEYAPGSHKGRLGMVLAEQMKLKDVKNLLVSSSGNFAESVSFYTLGGGIEVTVVTDVLSSRKLISKLEKYSHVKTVVIDNPDETGSHLKARLEFIDSALRKDKSLYFLDQYGNKLLPAIYECSLAEEIWRQTSGEVSSLFFPCGTGATIAGLANRLKKLKPTIRVFAVDAFGSNLFRPAKGKRKLPGYGNSKATDLIKEAYKLIDYVIYVADPAAVEMCHSLKREGIWVGPSSGAAVAAFCQVNSYSPHLLPNYGIPVVVAPDGGENYTENVFSEEWCRNNFSVGPKRNLHYANQYIV